MNTNFSREQYKQRYVTPRGQIFSEYNSPINQSLRMIQLSRFRNDSIISFYDNENESKWNVVRQRLPDILALSSTYKPTHIRAQLLFLIALTNRQTNELRRLSNCDFSQDLSHILDNVLININNRKCLISLKHIPAEEMIHVDVDGLSFSIPTRQFIIAISLGNAHVTAAKYCPPAVGDMLINLSKKKVEHEGRQHKRALFKMRIGKLMFFSLFLFIILMILALIISVINTIFRLRKPMPPF